MARNPLQAWNTDTSNPLGNAPSYPPEYADAPLAEQGWLGRALQSRVVDPVAAWLAKQQQDAIDRGLWTGGEVWQGGRPTRAGVMDALHQTAEGVAMGTTSSGGGGFPIMYHGSPHKFPPTPRNPLGEFDPARIGTGEGAQAYGVGAGYLAEREGIAKEYRDALTREKGRGHYWQDASGKEVNIDALRGLPEGHPDSMAANMLHQRGSVDEAIADVTNYGPSAFAGGKPEMDAALKGLQAMKERGLERVVDKGHMYEVRVHADPERFLHWDKPLSEQHPDVQKAVRASIGNAQPVQLRDGRYAITHVQPDGSGRVLWDIAEASPEAAREMYSQWLSSSSGREIYQHLARGLETTPGNESAAASQALQKAGIPGIRYLDQGSRGAGGGTHNAVVFDAATMEIIRRYGLAAFMAGGGAAVGAQQQPNALAAPYGP